MSRRLVGTFPPLLRTRWSSLLVLRNNDHSSSSISSTSSSTCWTKPHTTAPPFHPLGPPQSLQCNPIIMALPPLSDSITTTINSISARPDTTTPPVTIQRLSHNPDIFLARNFIPQQHIRSMLIQYATQQGMKVAGTRQSAENTIRKNSYLTWLSPEEMLQSSSSYQNDYDSVDPENQEVAQWVQAMKDWTVEHLVHESLRNIHVVPPSHHPTNHNHHNNNNHNNDWILAEDVQIAKYDRGGKFEEHHDGYGRFLTVLTYLNGVGGTFFPFAQPITRTDTTSQQQKMEKEEMPLSLLQTREGLLIVGKEGLNPYMTTDGEKIAPASIVPIQDGDAIVFYNYQVGERDMSSVHESLTVPCEEKWIATNWVRCEKLTEGRLAHLYLERLVEQYSSSSLSSSSSSSSSCSADSMIAGVTTTAATAGDSSSSNSAGSTVVA